MDLDGNQQVDVHEYTKFVMQLVRVTCTWCRGIVSHRQGSARMQGRCILIWRYSCACMPSAWNGTC
jgi:hypothetical protein